MARRCCARGDAGDDVWLARRCRRDGLGWTWCDAVSCCWRDVVVWDGPLYGEKKEKGSLELCVECVCVW